MKAVYKKFMALFLAISSFSRPQLFGGDPARQNKFYRSELARMILDMQQTQAEEVEKDRKEEASIRADIKVGSDGKKSITLPPGPRPYGHRSRLALLCVLQDSGVQVIALPPTADPVDLP